MAEWGDEAGGNCQMRRAAAAGHELRDGLGGRVLRRGAGERDAAERECTPVVEHGAAEVAQAEADAGAPHEQRGLGGLQLNRAV